MEYQDFDIRIEKGADGYLLIANSLNFGEAHNELRMDLVTSELQSDLERLAARQTDQHFLNHFGIKLYNALFPGDIDRIFQRSFGETLLRAETGIRVRLRIQVPEIASIPWEFLYSSIDHCYLGTLVHCPLLRYQDLPIADRSFKVNLPVNMLVVVPGMLEGYPDIDTASEIQNLNQALEGMGGKVNLNILDKHVTWSDISDALMDVDYHCFHFIGHGLFKNDRGFLLLNAANHTTDCVDEEKFAGLFRNHTSMKLVVLNSCQGATVSSSSPLVGIAPRLVQHGVPAVVAMQYSVYDDIAVLFSRDFYRSLFRGKNKGRVEVAMSLARNTLATNYPEERDLATPVLFMRSKTGVLFEPVTGSLIKDLPISQPALDTARVTAQTYEINAALLRKEQERSPDPGLVKALFKTQESLKDLKKRILLGNCAFISALALAIVFFLLAWINLFDLLTLDTRLETLTMWAGDRLVTKSMSQEIVTVAIDAKSQLHLGGFGPNWRRYHAKLIDTLSQAGAKVVVVSFVFKKAVPSDDMLLLDAIHQAQDPNHGTKIVVGFNEYNNGVPNLFDGLENAVSGVGIACMGRRLDATKTAYLAVSNNNDKMIPSLELQAYALYHDMKIASIDWQNHRIEFSGTTHQDLKLREFSEWRFAREDEPGCPVIKESDRIADLYIDLTPLDIITDPKNRFSYLDVLNATDQDQLERFKDKIVIVGIENKETTYNVVGGHRYGYQLTADTLNTLMQATAIRPLRAGGQLAVMLLIALLAASGSLLAPHRKFGGFKSLFVLIPAASLVCSVYMYAFHQLLLNTGYHIAVFLLTFLVTDKVKRRWFA